MQGTVVGVLRGGPSSEHEVSLASGASMLRHMPERYRVRDIYIDKEGVWHEHGKQTTPGRVLSTLDVALLPLHGAYGQDGEVQKVLERFGVPYTGADPFAAFKTSHKVLAKEEARRLGVRTARYSFIEAAEELEAKAREVTRTFSQPVVVKPVGAGSSVGVSILHGYAPLVKAAQDLFESGVKGVLVEERIAGVEATVGVVEGLRGEALYALPPIEIVPPAGQGFFTYDAKYSGETVEICPGHFTRPIADELMRLAKLMHSELEQRHYSRSDFIVSPQGIYFLETNTAAAVGMTAESLFPKALAAVGVSYPDFLSHLVGLALATKRR